MKYAMPLTGVLSVTDDGTTYEYPHYRAPLSLTGVTDESHPDYDPNTTYNTGDYVIVPDLKRIYRCVADGTAGVFPPSDPSKWVDYGFVNSYRMLSEDDQIGEKTTGIDAVMEFDFSQCDTFAMLDCEFVSVWVKQIDGDGNTVRDYTIDGRDIGCTMFAEYFYEPIREKTRAIADDLEWLPTSTLRLTFSGDVSVGTLVVGQSEELGCTLMGTAIRFEDRSKIQNDEITNTRKVIRYGHVRILDAKLIFDTGDYDTTVQKISELVGKNALFVPAKSDLFSEMANLAYIESANLPVSNPTKFDANLTLIGVTG